MIASIRKLRTVARIQMIYGMCSLLVVAFAVVLASPAMSFAALPFPSWTSTITASMIPELTAAT